MTQPDVLAERARIQEQIEGRTLVDALADTVSAYADQPAYSDRHHVPEGESWRTLTWSETHERALDVAAALIEIGVAPGDTVAIMATNRVEHFIADIGAVHAAATPMSIYNTLSPEQVAFVAGHAQPTVVFLETADHKARWAKALEETDSVKRVVVARRRRLGRPGGRRRGVPRRQPRRRRRPRRRGHPGLPRDDPLHVRHDREPEGRRAHPPQRALRGHLHPGERPG